MTISTLPTFPVAGDPNFEVKADAWVGALPQFVTEANATALAMNLNALLSTSTTGIILNLNPSNGYSPVRSLVTGINKSYQPGMYLVVARTSDPVAYSIICQVISYNPSTGALTVSRRSGTLPPSTSTIEYYDWTISPVGVTNTSSLGGSLIGKESEIEMQRLLGSPSVFSNDNLIVNGNFSIDLRNNGVAKTIVAGAAPVYTADRFFASCVGANITVQQVASGNKKALLVSWPIGCTSFKIGTRIASGRCQNIGIEITDFWRLILRASCPTGDLATINWSMSSPTVKDAFGTLASPTVVAFETSSIGPGSGSLVTPQTLVRTFNSSANIRRGAALSFGPDVISAAGSLLLEDVYLGEGLQAVHPNPEEQIRDCQFYCNVIAAHTRATATAINQSFDSPVYFPSMFKNPTATYIAATGVNANASGSTLFDIEKNSARQSITSLAAGDSYALNRKYLLDAEV